MIWAALVVFLVLVGLALLVGGAVVVFLRLRSGVTVDIPMRLLLRLYLYVVIIVGLILFTQGTSHLLRAGFAAAWGDDFSYNPVYVPYPVRAESPRAIEPLELKERAALTDQEREELSRLLADRERQDLELRREQRKDGLERAREEGLIQGVSFVLIGGIIWLVHVLGRRWLETEEELRSPLNRVYLIIIVVIFAVITIVNLPQAVFEGLRFAFLDPLDEFDGRYQPGSKLALSIASLPIWITYLAEAIRAVRKGG